MKVDPLKTADVRAVNRSTVLAELLKSRPTTRKQLARDSGLSAATISRTIDDLILEGIVYEGAELTSSSRGRRAIEVDASKDRTWVVGVDIGASKCRFSVANFIGEPVALKTVDTPRHHDPANFTTWLLEKSAETAGTRWNRTSAICVGVPGSVHDDQSAIDNAPNLEIIEKPEFLDSLHENAGRILTVENDVNLALLGEQVFGAARDTPNAALVNIGAGLGTALSVDKLILRGATGLIGEYGNMPFADSRLENYLTGPGLAQLLKHANADDPRPETLFQDSSGQFAALRQLVDTAFVTLLTAVSVSVEPTVLILGGGVVESLKPSFSRYQDLLNEYVHQAPKLVSAHLGELSGAIGAHVAALRSLYRELGISDAELTDLPQISEHEFQHAFPQARSSVT